MGVLGENLVFSNVGTWSDEYFPRQTNMSVVYVIYSSGIRLGAWEYLRWKDMEAIIENDELVAAKLTVYEGTDEQYITFITPEAYNSLKQWMEFREKSGEKIKVSRMKSQSLKREFQN